MAIHFSLSVAFDHDATPTGHPFVLLPSQNPRTAFHLSLLPSLFNCSLLHSASTEVRQVISFMIVCSEDVLHVLTAFSIMNTGFF